MATEKIKATASITIIDETDASTLTGNMLVVKGSKNQIYLTGQANPYSPDWSKNNLIIRPFLQASNVTKKNSVNVEYCPDLFNPEEYPNGLDNYGYIQDIHWYLRDSAGVETELGESANYSLSATYTIGGEKVICNDSRQLVIKNNVLLKNRTADIVCRFSFYDPFANINITQQLETTIMNIASGLSNSRLVTTCINGNTITNTSTPYIDIIAQFYGDSGELDIGESIETGEANVSCLWYVRKSDGWYLLDPTQNGQSVNNLDVMLYEIKKIDSLDEDTGNYVLESYAGDKGNAAIRIYPALINGSEVIKCVYTDYTGAKYSSIQVIQDVTDETRIEMYCSNGRRLKRGLIDNTIAKAMITYKGELLEDSSPLYDTNFDYYWYKYTRIDDKYVNVYNDARNDIVENDDLVNPIAGGRTLYIDTEDISPEEHQAEFILDVFEKEVYAASVANEAFYAMAISEEDLGIAMNLNRSIGIEDDLSAAILTAQELNIED